MFLIFIITFIRIITFKGLSYDKEPVADIPSVCLTGLSELFIPRDVTYSTYILTSIHNGNNTFEENRPRLFV
jgi:hypothetical protein